MDMTRTAAIIVTIIAALAAGAIYAQDGLSRVPAGTFSRGSNDGKEDERPVRSVQMSSFAMMAREVTEGQYRRCVDAGKCTPARYDDGGCMAWTGRGFQRVTVPAHLRGDGLPVVCVTWQQARAYCASQGMRLPTEAQWEYAALGGKAVRYSWGDARPDASRCAMGTIKQAGSFAPNGYGLYDMTGNVWEWTADFYVADFYETSEQADPKGPGAGYYRVIRGGGWYSGPSEMRIQNRHWFAPAFAEVSVGFRCVK
ncbi:MAG: formylglycine-generating enzyme family protein [Chitinispirillia bacterium]|nr:formylglycine-generating enzyme family protein [Chitinispirillia bacterium]MCL2268241.1 formylglycine-generating enzyme family protein [Chitinispirillia bacterium]